jgi:hypothetical protein
MTVDGSKTQSGIMLQPSLPFTLMQERFSSTGWLLFPRDIAIEHWIAHALPAARQVVQHPDHRQWLRCSGTWFAGVNALPNDNRGAINGGPALAGQCVDFIVQSVARFPFDWDRGQVSVCYPGYPKPMVGESATAYQYRVNKDAAHVDGIIAEGAERRRYIREHHAFILGIPLVEVSSGASPFVVWEGSHRIVQTALQKATRGRSVAAWRDADITDIYQVVRRQVFESCRRVEISARPGQSYLIHRHILHGTAPWQETAHCGPDGRMILYFRPQTTDLDAWLSDP